VRYYRATGTIEAGQAVLFDGPGEVRAAYVNDQPVCPGCLEFGTICRPCRRARYEAGLAARQRAERRHHRSRVRVALIGGLGVLLFLIAAQCVLDRRCGDGHRWNGETMACEARR